MADNAQTDAGCGSHNGDMRAADVHNERLYYAVKGCPSHNYVIKEARHAHADRYPPVVPTRAPSR